MFKPGVEIKLWKIHPTISMWWMKYKTARISAGYLHDPGRLCLHAIIANFTMVAGNGSRKATCRSFFSQARRSSKKSMYQKEMSWAISFGVIVYCYSTESNPTMYQRGREGPCVQQACKRSRRSHRNTSSNSASSPPRRFDMWEGTPFGCVDGVR